MNNHTYQRRPRSNQAAIQRNIQNLLGYKDPSSIRRLRRSVEAKGYEGNDIGPAMLFERCHVFPEDVTDPPHPYFTPKPEEKFFDRHKVLMNIQKVILNDLTVDNYSFVYWLLKRQPSILRCVVIWIANRKLHERYKLTGREPSSLQVKFIEEFTKELQQESS